MSSLSPFRGIAGAALVLTTWLVTACASPTAPSKPVSPTPDASVPATPSAPAAAPVTLTVRVLQRSVETPLPGAFVQLGTQTVRADQGGVCQFTLAAGETADVGVSHPGFEPLGATGVLTNDQRWTFYLAPTTH